MSRKLTITTALFLLVFSSCRDYLTDVIDLTPPDITTNEVNYTGKDTIIVTLFNKSYSDIYVTGTYNTVEKQNFANWDIYSIMTCSGGCPEFIVPAKGSTTARVVILGSTGNFRMVCYYSKKPGIPQGQKSVVYSNEFQIQ